MRFLSAAIVCLLISQAAVAQQRLVPELNYGEPNGLFPNWQERAVQELTNRARSAPATDLAGCPSGQCLDAACYPAIAPVFWLYDLNQSARFHSASMGRMAFFDHNTPCVLFSDIDARYPGTSDGSTASSCSGNGTTTPNVRIPEFGASFNAENIAAGGLYNTPDAVFYGWLYEPTASATCTSHGDNGHRYNMFHAGPALGVGYEVVGGSPWGIYWTQDFGGSGTVPKIPSGSHWTSSGKLRDPSGGDNNVEFWANWFDTAGPTTANLVLDGVPTAMTRLRGTATNGAYSVTVNAVAAGCHAYYFAFVDSTANAVRYPDTGALGFGTSCPDFQSNAPAPPTGVEAHATSSTQVAVSWTVVAGATSYEIWRRDPGATSFVKRGTSATTPFNDTATANNAYLYRVRAVGATGTSGDSAYDLATTVIFTEDPLVGGTTVIKAIHLAELRTAVNAVRAQVPAQGPATVTDAASPGVVVKAVHITELRSALDAEMSLLSLTTGGWTDAVANGVTVKAIHFQQIRDRVK